MPGLAQRLAAAAAVVVPGLLVAATGVGAGDLSTAGFAGSRMGLAILWAVALGALLKFVLTEGIARHQLATGDTVLEAAHRRIGRGATIAFLAFLLPWSVFTGGALVNAAGAAGHAVLPLFADPAHDKVAYGIASSAVGFALVRLGGFGWFERVMTACVGVMFVAVVAVGAMLVVREGAVSEALRGAVVPSVPHDPGDPGSRTASLRWTLALLGGVGGTVTILCYGYWMREVGRAGAGALRTCRIDLAVGYVATALFGMAMVAIARGVPVEGRGVALIADLASHLESVGGPSMRWLFLAGAWCAVFSSLLGVWQSVPYLFADAVRLLASGRDGAGRRGPLERSGGYRAYLAAIAVVPLVTLWHDFRSVQAWYGIVGACFLPLLAVALLALNRSAVVGAGLRNRWPAIVGLLLTLAVFAWYGWNDVRG